MTVGDQITGEGAGTHGTTGARATTRKPAVPGTVEFGNNEVRETNAARQWQAVPPRPHTCAPLLAGRDTRRHVTGGPSDG
jgi:hypothetical protein